MTAMRKFAAVIAAVLSLTLFAAAQDAAPSRKPFCRVKLDSGITLKAASLYFEPSQVTIRDNTGVLLAIPNDRLLDAMETTRGSQLPLIGLFAALQSNGDDMWSAAFALGTAVIWDTGAGISRLFRRPRHFVTLTFEQDGETRSQTMQLSASDAARLVDAVNLRRSAPPQL